MGFSINFFLTISIALFTYLAQQKKNYPLIKSDCDLSIQWALIFYSMVMVLMMLSILAGFISIISRLYDLRLTRQIAFVRKRTLKKLNKFLPDESSDFKNANVLTNFLTTLRGSGSVKQEINIDNYEQIRLEFIALRNRTKLLGELSWKAHIFQITVLILSMVVYSLTLIFSN